MGHPADSLSVTPTCQKFRLQLSQRRDIPGRTCALVDRLQFKVG